MSIAVLGAGKIARMVAHFLGRSGGYEVRVGDVRGDAARGLAARIGDNVKEQFISNRFGRYYA